MYTGIYRDLHYKPWFTSSHSSYSVFFLLSCTFFCFIKLLWFFLFPLDSFCFPLFRPLSSWIIQYLRSSRGRLARRWNKEAGAYEAVSGWGPDFGLFEDKSPSAFLKMTYPNILVPKFIWHIQLFIHVWYLYSSFN